MAKYQRRLSMYGLELLTGPVLEPVTVAEAAQHLRLDPATTDAEAVELDLMISAARQEAEAWTSRAFITQSWDLTLPNLWNVILLPLGNILSVDGAYYIYRDGSKDYQDAPANCTLDNTRRPARCVSKTNWDPPDPAQEVFRAGVEFTAGYGPDPSDVPQGLRIGILMLLANRYEYRGDSESQVMPTNARDQLEQYRFGGIFHEYALAGGVW